MGALLLASIGYAAHRAMSGGEQDGDGSAPGVSAEETVRVTTTAQGTDRRDDIAAEPMLRVPESAAFPAEPNGPDVPGIEIPSGRGVVGPGLVTTGYPHTPEGAAAQLAQIDIATLQAMSVQVADEVYRTWALPGGVGPEAWWITQTVEEFLTSSQMGEVKDPAASVKITPSAALIKGTDGPDWALACVLLKATASYRQEAEIAFGHCERMQWVGGRWMIGPGTPPEPGPSTWPGTQWAADAGWRTWVTDHMDGGHQG
ncbi:MAG: hypothetical protein L0H74_00595 [Brachybacterium sp.]|nr:hypothetical protein [Brachybacterium sp.]